MSLLSDHVRAVIADDDEGWCFLIRRVLEQRGAEVVGEARDSQGALEAFRRTEPDLVILDLAMPGIGGLATMEIVLRERPATRVVMCSVLDEFRQAAIDGGARWATKDEGVEALVAAALP